MTEFELVEVFHFELQWLLSASMNAVTVTFAYIVASHIAGANLSKGAAFGMTAIYSVFLIGPLAGIIGASQRMTMTVYRYIEIYPDGWAFTFPVSSLLYLITSTPIILAWIASVSYLHLYVRRDGT